MLVIQTGTPKKKQYAPNGPTKGKAKKDKATIMVLPSLNPK